MILLHVFLIIALVILTEDGSTFLFSQKCIGNNYSIFNIYEFCSMKKNTKNVATHLLACQV